MHPRRFAAYPVARSQVANNSANQALRHFSEALVRESGEHRRPSAADSLSCTSAYVLLDQVGEGTLDRGAPKAMLSGRNGNM